MSTSERGLVKEEQMQQAEQEKLNRLELLWFLPWRLVALASFCSGLFHPKNEFPATNPHLTALEYVYICSLLAAVMITAPNLS